MRKTLQTLLVGFALVMGSSLNYLMAQTLKIGYTEPNLILVQMPEYKLVLQKLDAEYQSSDAEIRLKAQDFQTKLEDYQRKQAFMSDSTKAQTERELLALQQEVQEMQNNKSQALQQKEVEFMQPLFDKITAAINEVAKEKGLDFVFSTRVSSTGPILLYSKTEEADITKPVMDKLGIKAPAPAADAKPAGNAAPASNKPAAPPAAPAGNNKPKGKN